VTLFDGPDVVTFDVVGTPSTQGSMRAFIAGGKPVVAQGGSAASRKALSSWREAVAAEARAAFAGAPLLACPVQVRLNFRLLRPASAPKTTRTWPIKARSGDVDKLARAVLDAITGVLIADDSQVIGLVVSKDWGNPPGCAIALRPVLR
jgi:crossover junction endodeoxyribonuclease RusA